MGKALQQVAQRGPWRIEEHSWACPSHYLFHHSAFLRRVAVNGAVLAGRFMFAKSAMVEPSAGIVGQIAVGLLAFCIVQLMFGIEIHHQSDGLLVAFYPLHACFRRARLPVSMWRGAYL